MNKALILILLLAASVNCTTITANTAADEAAYKKVDDLLDKATTQINKAANSLDTTAGKIDETAIQANITATQLTAALQAVRNTAFSKIEMVDELLNKTSATERAVIEKAFNVIEQIITEVNKYTNWDVADEYEAAQVSEYVQARIEEAKNLLTDVRKYIVNFVDLATDKIASVTPPIIEAISVVSDVVSKTSDDLKSIADLFAKQKELYQQRALEANAAGLPNLLGTEEVSRKWTFDDYLNLAKQIGDGESLQTIATSLPQSKAKQTIQNILDTADTAKQAINIAAQTVQRAGDAYQTIKNGNYDTASNTLNTIRDVASIFA